MIENRIFTNSIKEILHQPTHYLGIYYLFSVVKILDVGGLDVFRVRCEGLHGFWMWEMR